MATDTFNRIELPAENLFVVGDIWIHETQKARLEIIEIHKKELTVTALKGPKTGETLKIPKNMLNGILKSWWNEKNENKKLFPEE